ncbi:hypothetical protein OPV22_021684 [Ensete ventricosum]|uniref:Uncharacterized protein n=1 Tax=Ensete ventricosum TaxID=4639 RepID=A0AAV8QHN8_ENSVE|nr:hypothetical protein OPV22_021684 [Ensete ventricosum]
MVGDETISVLPASPPPLVTADTKGVTPHLLVCFPTGVKCRDLDSLLKWMPGVCSNRRRLLLARGTMSAVRCIRVEAPLTAPILPTSNESSPRTQKDIEFLLTTSQSSRACTLLNLFPDKVGVDEPRESDFERNFYNLEQHVHGYASTLSNILLQ